MPARRKSHKTLELAQIEAVAHLFSVLAEPTRLRILQALRSGPASVGELCTAMDIKQANASKQLGILLSAGIILRKQAGNRAIYSIGMPLVFELCDVVCSNIAKQAAHRAKALRG